MIAPDLSTVTIFVRPGVTDMRKQANGLSLMVEEQMELDPGSGNLFLFCNKERKLLKCLWWDRNGFWLAQKRLESGKFPWPLTMEQARQIRTEELGMLLSGIDFWNAHQSISYQQIN